MSTRDLSELLKHSTGYVGMVETTSNKGQYPPHEWPKLAKALNCTVRDLLPPDELDQKSTGELVEKVVISLSNKNDLKRVIEALIAQGFFDSSKTIKDISRHLLIEKKEQIDLLFEVMNIIVKEGSLKQRISEYYRDIV